MLKPEPPPPGRLKNLGTAAFIFVWVAGLLVISRPPLFPMLHTLGFASAKGVVNSAVPKFIYQTKYRKMYALTGDFQFVVDGKEVHGSRFGRTDRGPAWRQMKAEALSATVLAAKNVEVRYNPSDPSDCYATVEGQGSEDAMTTGTCILAATIGIVGVRFGIRGVKGQPWTGRP